MATVATNGKPRIKADEGTAKLKPIQRSAVTMLIRGTSPLIQHAWGDKGLREMRERHAGKRTRNREIRNPEAEYHEAMYKTQDGRPGINILAIKAACISAAHKDIGIEKTLVRKSLFVRSSDASLIEPLILDDEPAMREDCVRVGAGSTDLRYRPQFDTWAVNITFEIDKELLRVEDLVNLLNRAGFGVGVGEWRPEKGGEFGRFKVDEAFGIKEEIL